jgi:hypothetical protein
VWRGARAVSVSTSQASLLGEKLARMWNSHAHLKIPNGTGRFFKMEFAMEKSVSEARWVLIPVFGLSGIAMFVGIIFG